MNVVHLLNFHFRDNNQNYYYNKDGQNPVNSKNDVRIDVWDPQPRHPLDVWAYCQSYYMYASFMFNVHENVGIAWDDFFCHRPNMNYVWVFSIWNTLHGYLLGLRLISETPIVRKGLAHEMELERKKGEEMRRAPGSRKRGHAMRQFLLSVQY